MRKKWICLMLVLIQVISVFAFIPALAEEAEVISQTTASDDVYAEVVFDNSTREYNLKSTMYSPVMVKKDGKMAVKRDAESNYYIYCDLDEKFYQTNDPQSLKITVEYFDEGNGCFGISYNSLNNALIGGFPYANAEQICHMENTKTWKTFEFHIDNMILGTGFSDRKEDMRLAAWTSDMGATKEPVYIHSIKFEKTFPKVPVTMTVTSDYTGNMFDVDEEKKLYINMSNSSLKESKSKVTYYYENESGIRLGEGEFEENIAARETAVHEVLLDVGKENALYTLYAHIESTFEGVEGVFEYDRKGEFSVFEKFGEDDVKSSDFYMNMHFTYDDCVAEYGDVLSWGGFGGVRDPGIFWWHEWEKTKGVMTPPEKTVETIEMLKEHNIKLISGTMGSNPLYEPDVPYNRAIIPHTYDTRVAAGKFQAYVEEYMESVGAGHILKGIELWNEPNVTVSAPGQSGFNYYGANDPRGDASVYAGYQEVAYKTMKDIGVKAPVIGISCAMADVAYVKKVFENGGYDTLDEISIHPYDWSGGFRIQKWIDEMSQIKQMMIDRGGAKPITNSEMGFSSAVSDDALKSEKLQACYMLEVYVVGKGEELCDTTCYYNLMEKGIDPTNREHCFGIIRNFTHAETPMAAKPAFITAVGANKLLATAKPESSIKRDDNIWCYNFKRTDGKNVAVVWAYGEDENICFDLGTDKVEVLDLYTNKVADMTSADGKYNIKLKEEPIYIVGSFTKFEEAENSFTTSASEVNAVPGDLFTIDYSDAKGRDLEFEIDAPKHIEVVKNDGMKSGKGGIEFKLSPDANGKQYINVKIKSGDVIEFIDTITVTSVDPIEVSIDSSQISENDSERWQADVTITNTSFVNSISGKVSLTGPEEVVPYANAPRFNELKPHESVTLHINLDPMTKKRVRTMTFEIELDNGFKTSVAKDLNFTSAQYTTKKPKIDGRIDIGEWNGAWLTADRKENTYSYDNNWTADNCSVNSNMMWDEENLYFAAVVTDDIFYQDATDPSKMWSADSVQFAMEDKVDSGTYQFIGSVVSEVTEFGMSIVSGKPVMWKYLSLYDKPTGLMGSLEFDVKRQDNKTIYEAVIPWSEIFYDGYKPEENKIRFSLLVNDHDGDKRKMLEYNSGIGDGKNALLFGKMQLFK